MATPWDDWSREALVSECSRLTSLSAELFAKIEQANANAGEMARQLAITRAEYSRLADHATQLERRQRDHPPRPR